MKYTVVLTEKGDGNVIHRDVGPEPDSDNLHHVGTPWEWFGAFKNNPTWGKLFDELEQQRDRDRGKKNRGSQDLPKKSFFVDKSGRI